jgi:Ca2+-binding RTX toxin-like protein
VVGTNFDDTLIGSAEANTLVGAEGADSLSGGGGNDTLLGGLGNDRLDGGAGNDSMAGEGGDDFYVVNSASDVVLEAAGGGADTVQSSASYVLGAELEALVLTGSATRGTGNTLANTLVGTGGANTLDGKAGNDSLDGGGGDDVLIGDAGADTLSGGAGADRFVIQSASNSYRNTIDRILDMTLGVDDIVLSGAAGRFGSGVDPAAVDFNGVVTVDTAALGTGTTTYGEVMAGINAALLGAANVTASGTLAGLQVWQVNVTGGTAAGTYVFVNDGVAGASASTDALIAVTLIGGPALSQADFILG